MAGHQAEIVDHLAPFVRQNPASPPGSSAGVPAHGPGSIAYGIAGLTHPERQVDLFPAIRVIALVEAAGTFQRLSARKHPKSHAGINDCRLGKLSSIPLARADVPNGPESQANPHSAGRCDEIAGTGAKSLRSDHSRIRIAPHLCQQLVRHPLVGNGVVVKEKQRGIWHMLVEPADAQVTAPGSAEISRAPDEMDLRKAAGNRIGRAVSGAVVHDEYMTQRIGLSSNTLETPQRVLPLVKAEHESRNDLIVRL